MKTPDWASQAGDKCAASAVPTLPRLYCGVCKTDVEPVLYWSGPHIRADCSRCGRYIKFCPKVAPWTELVPPPVIMPSLFEDAA